MGKLHFVTKNVQMALRNQPRVYQNVEGLIKIIQDGTKYKQGVQIYMFQQYETKIMYDQNFILQKKSSASG